MRVICELLGNSFELPSRPCRIISLVRSATKTMTELGCAERVVDVSPYCRRYAPEVAAPVVGDDLGADMEVLRALQPDLIFLTTGVQGALACRLAEAGLSAYALPLPSSRFGILENIVTLGALLGELRSARSLANRLNAAAEALRAQAPAVWPRVYAELWFGRHPRMVGGRCFVHDLIEWVGGDNIFAGNPGSYLSLDLPSVVTAHPQTAIFFSEPESPVSAAALLAERGWLGLVSDRVMECGLEKGRNLIHSGPSYFATAAWLHVQRHNRVT